MANVLIFHGTEGYPEENWFPWMKTELESKGHTVFVPQFPSPPIVPAKLGEWFDVLEEYRQYIDSETIIIGHSLGGVFTLRVLEQLIAPINTACFVGTPVGIKPITFYDRDVSFSGFDFNWDAIKRNAQHFIAFQSDDDPYVGLANGEELAARLGVDLSFVPNSGHFNAKAGYTRFEALRDKILELKH
jgi:predicted alpha/beta hydrolase family esterase